MAKIRKREGSFIVIMFTIVFLLTACGGGDKSSSNLSEDVSEELSSKQVLNLSESADFTSLDIHHASDAPSFDALYQINSGLMGFDEDENFIPDLAEDKPELSDDKTVYTFTIREDAEWENGDPVTANDFVYAWKRAVDPDTASEYAFIFESSEILNAADIMNKDSNIYGEVDKLGVEALDDNTLEVTLEKATPYFEGLMSFPPFYPLNEEFVEELGEDFATTADHLLSNGPFKLSKWHIGEGWTYEKNETYWNADDIKLEEVNVKLVKDSATRVNLYETGQLDYTELTSQYIDQFTDHEDLHTGDLTSDMKFMRTNQKHEALANENIRNAIYNAFDRQDLVDSLLKDGSQPAYFVVPEDWAFEENGMDFREKYNEINKKSVEKAQELWEKGLKEIGESEVTIDIMFGESDIGENIVTYLQSQLEENLPGLTVNINKQPYNQHLKLEGERKYDISYWGWLPDYLDPITYLEIWLTDAPFNRTGFSNEDYDDLIKQAEKSGDDPEKRWEMLQDAEKYLMEDASVIPIYQSARAYVLDPKVKNLIPRNYGPTIDFRYAYIEE